MSEESTDNNTDPQPREQVNRRHPAKYPVRKGARMVWLIVGSVLVVAGGIALWLLWLAASGLHRLTGRT